MDTQVADLLGGERVLGPSVKSNLDLARATRKGLPAETAVQLVEAIQGADFPIQPERVAVAVKAIDPRAMGPLGSLIGSLHTVNRRNMGDGGVNIALRRLTPEESDIVIRTARTLAKAIDILGDRKKASHWLTTPNRALGGEIPMTLLDTSAGAHEVEAVLDRIEYGVYS